jgi:hypothetical protein
MILFTKHISLIQFHETIWEVYKICEECYYHYIEWANDQNKSCTYWEVMKLCSWKFLNLNYFCQRKVCLNFWNLNFTNDLKIKVGPPLKIIFLLFISIVLTQFSNFILTDFSRCGPPRHLYLEMRFQVRDD